MLLVISKESVLLYVTVSVGVISVIVSATSLREFEPGSLKTKLDVSMKGFPVKEGVLTKCESVCIEGGLLELED